jgi:hypothetical protein
MNSPVFPAFFAKDRFSDAELLITVTPLKHQSLESSARALRQAISKLGPVRPSAMRRISEPAGVFYYFDGHTAPGVDLNYLTSFGDRRFDLEFSASTNDSVFNQIVARFTLT